MKTCMFQKRSIYLKKKTEKTDACMRSVHIGTRRLRKGLLTGAAIFLFTLNAAAMEQAGAERGSSKLDGEEPAAVSFIRRNSLHNTMLVPHRYPLIEKFRTRYTTEEGLRYLEGIMQRSVQYRLFILEEIRRENLPAELLFLPVIESGFHSKAVSRAGAVGIWQFMRNSIGGFDINVNEWLDERRDPWKASVAAVKKLRWNYSRYNDWYLALAAYNCGVGALDKAIKAAGSKNYWYLAEKGFLKPETALYVAKFLAVSEILTQSKQYGINWGEPVSSDATDVIKIKRSVDLVMLAEELNAEFSLFSDLNPSLKYNITPPNVEYGLRVPAEHKEAVQDLLSKNKLLVKHYTYKIKSGDTLYALSKHYGVGVEVILKYNPKIRSKALKVGQTLYIPALKSVAAYKGGSETQGRAFNGHYKIKKGDTLWSIALKFNIQVEQLAEKNGINVNAVLSLGQLLKVPIL